MFSTKISRGKAFAAEQKTRDFDKYYLKVNILYKNWKNNQL